jgi:hypothetical protein
VKNIEEKIITNASPQMVFKVWKDRYLPAGFDVGKTGHIITEKKKGVKFKIEDIKENEYLKVMWYSHFIKLSFLHKVQKVSDGTLITCLVEIRGFFAFLIRPLIQKSIRKNLQTSLNHFKRGLNNL